MNVASWMSRSVITVKPGDSARHARELMEKHRINQVPVVLDGRLVGVVTDRDLRDVFPSVFEEPEMRRVRRAKPGGDPTTVPVHDVMAPDVFCVAPEAPLADAAQLMRRERIGAVPIVSEERLVGILTRSDILDAFMEVSRRAPSRA